MSKLPGLVGIAHWALKVHDLERSLAFYRDTLGFDEMLRLSNNEGPSERHFSLVYLRVTDTQYVELFPDGKGAQSPDERTTCITHICLQVDSIEETAAQLTKLGVPLYRSAKLGLDGNNQCWVVDPDGNRIEFMQMLAGNMQDAAIKRLRGWTYTNGISS
jgi:lactoylglutathione lyase